MHTLSALGASGRPLKIDIVVHGRFYAFHLASALIAQGHDVVVLTNYPAFVAARFGLPKPRVSSFVLHGVIARIFHRMPFFNSLASVESGLHRIFGRWAARKVRRSTDVVHVFSGVAQEILESDLARASILLTVARASSHIREQSELLMQEQERIVRPIDRPSEWMIAREEAEYARADLIVTVSEFSRNSFLARGLPRSHVACLALGVDVTRFSQASADARIAREKRVLAGEPLRVLMTGSFSARKGAADFAAIANGLKGQALFRFVGDVPEESYEIRVEAKDAIEFVPRVREFDLPAQYAWADVFLFPTIEDGFPVVISQALASGLPVLATTNCCAPDIVQEGNNGWILPIRSPDKFIDRLRWCDARRPEFAQMLANVATHHGTNRDWADVARDFTDTVCAHPKLVRQFEGSILP